MYLQINKKMEELDKLKRMNRYSVNVENEIKKYVRTKKINRYLSLNLPAEVLIELSHRKNFNELVLEYNKKNKNSTDSESCIKYHKIKTISFVGGRSVYLEYKDRAYIIDIFDDSTHIIEFYKDESFYEKNAHIQIINGQKGSYRTLITESKTDYYYDPNNSDYTVATIITEKILECDKGNISRDKVSEKRLLADVETIHEEDLNKTYSQKEIQRIRQRGK